MEHLINPAQAQDAGQEIQSGHGEDIAWMGYVGALAGLVIGLLLMIAVVGIGIGVLGRSALLSAKAQPALDPQQALITAPQLLKTARAQTPVTTPQRPAVVLALRFPEGEVVLDAASRQVLADQVKQRLGNEQLVTELLLMAVSSRGDARQQRLSYLRLLALRNVLLDIQIPAASIRSELFPAPDLPSPSPDVVYVALTPKGG